MHYNVADIDRACFFGVECVTQPKIAKKACYCIFSITQNTFSFVLLCGLVPLMLSFRSTIRYLFPMDDKYYEQMALKIQEKRCAKRR